MNSFPLMRLSRLLLGLCAAAFTALAEPAPPADGLVPNGTFEADADGDRWPDGWGKLKAGGSWQEEGGNHFLRLTSSTPGEMVMLYQQIRVPETVKAIELTFRMRVTGLQKGS